MRLLPKRSANQKAKLSKILDLDDFDRAARDTLPDAIYGYVAHGSETETTLRTNRAVFDDWRFVTRNLVGVTERQQDDHAVRSTLCVALRHRADGRQRAGGL